MAYNDVYVKTLQKGKDGATWHNGTVSRPISGSSDYQRATDGSGKTIAAVKGDLLFETALKKFYVWDGEKWMYLSGMPYVDATLAIQGDAADAKAAGDRIGTLEVTLDPAIETEQTAQLTKGAILNNGGVYVERLSDTQVKLYGTATGGRWWRLLNGEHTQTFSYSLGTGLFPAGRYTFEWSWTSTDPELTIALCCTPSGARNDSGSVYIQSGVAFNSKTPFTVNVVTTKDVDYGTQEEPTVLTVTGYMHRIADRTARAAIDDATENTGIAYFTDDIAPESGGVTVVRLSETEIILIGEAIKNRWWRLFNGEHAATYSETEGAGVFPAGRYTFTWSTNNGNNIVLSYTPVGDVNGNDRGGGWKSLPNGAAIEISGPFTVNVRTSAGVDYGSADSPTILTVTGTTNTAIDKVARQALNVTRVRDVPKNAGIRNAYKRALQLTNIRYFAAGDIPVPKQVTEEVDGRTVTTTVLDTIPEGTLCRGIPYGRTLRKDRMVGMNVSALSFLTAAHNPYSALYTEIVSSDGSGQSAYGISYADYETGASFPYFGTVCSGLISYVLGFPITTDSYRIPYFEHIGVLKKAPDQSSYGVELMDLIQYDGHVFVVVDIYRDARGNPVDIVFAESGIPLTRIGHYTPATFDARIRGYTAENKTYTIYRFVNGLEDKASLDWYRETPCIKMPGETPQNYVFPHHVGRETVPIDESPYVEAEKRDYGELQYNDDICIFTGDHSTFRGDELIVINFTKGDYTDLVITRDGETVRTVTLPTREGDVCHAIVLTTDSAQDGRYGDELGIGDADNYYVYLTPQGSGHVPGVYTAYLSGNGTESYETTWQVRSLPIGVTETADHGEITVAFDNTDSSKIPVGIQILRKSGAKQYAAIVLTDAERRIGFKTFDPCKAVVGQGAEIKAADYHNLYVDVQYRFKDTAGFPLNRGSDWVRLEYSYTTQGNSGYDNWRLSNLMDRPISTYDDDEVPVATLDD